MQGAHTGLTKSYICFSICKALQSLVLGSFCPKGLINCYFLVEKKVSELRNVVPTSEVKLPKSLLMMNHFAISKFLYPLNLI